MATLALYSKKICQFFCSLYKSFLDFGRQPSKFLNFSVVYSFSLYTRKIPGSWKIRNDTVNLIEIHRLVRKIKQYAFFISILHFYWLSLENRDETTKETRSDFIRALRLKCSV